MCLVGIGILFCIIVAFASFKPVIPIDSWDSKKLNPEGETRS